MTALDERSSQRTESGSPAAALFRSGASIVPLLIALLVGCLAVTCLAWLAQRSPLTVWYHLAIAPWTSWYGLGQILAKATPLLFLALSVWMSRQVGLLNLGILGQMAIGSLVFAVTAIALGEQSYTGGALVGVAAPLLAAMTGGAVLGASVGWLRSARRANEIVVSIAQNAIVLAAIAAVGRRWWFVGEAPRTAEIPTTSELPSFGWFGSQANVSLILALVLVIGCGYLVRRTRLGFSIRLVGHMPSVANSAGIAVTRTTVGAMAISGALAALASSHYVAGYKHAYELGLEGTVWFLGIAIAMLAEQRLSVLVGLAVMLGSLQHGGLLTAQLVPREITDTMIAVTMLALAAARRRTP